MARCRSVGSSGVWAGREGVARRRCCYKRKVNILLHTFMTHFGAALAKNFWDAKLPSGTIKAVKKFSKL